MERTGIIDELHYMLETFNEAGIGLHYERIKGLVRQLKADEQSKSATANCYASEAVPACGNWQKEKPDKPCLFVSREKYGEKPTLWFLDYELNTLCVFLADGAFSDTLDNFEDGEYFIVEFINNSKPEA